MLLHDAFYTVLRRAGELMLSYQDPAVYVKEGHANLVTEADNAVQAFLLEELHRVIPSAAFMAEEGEQAVLGDGLTFIIDPIDGTMNYTRRRASSVISVGLSEGKRAVAGAILNPYTGDLYHTERGQGAFCNSTQLHVSELPFSRALIELGSAPYRTDLNRLTANCVERLLSEAADIRRSGSAAIDLCNVAAGRADGMFEWNLQPWDYCAGSLLVEEAGGMAGQIGGGAVELSNGSAFIAGSAASYEPLRRLLNEVKQAMEAYP